MALISTVSGFVWLTRMVIAKKLIIRAIWHYSVVFKLFFFQLHDWVVYTKLVQDSLRVAVKADIYFFLFVFPPVWLLVFYISPTFFPLSSAFPFLSPCHFLLYRQSYPHENVTAAILSYAVSHLHERTGKLRKTCADTVGHLTESVPSQQFRCAGRGPAVTHPSTDPAKSCLTCAENRHSDLGDCLAPDTYHTPNTVSCKGR